MAKTNYSQLDSLGKARHHTLAALRFLGYSLPGGEEATERELKAAGRWTPQVVAQKKAYATLECAAAYLRTATGTEHPGLDFLAARCPVGRGSSGSPKEARRG